MLPIFSSSLRLSGGLLGCHILSRPPLELPAECKQTLGELKDLGCWGGPIEAASEERGVPQVAEKGPRHELGRSASRIAEG